LNIKYATADQIKTSFGYIGIISLSVLYGVILLNDLFKLISFCIRELNELIEEKAKEKSLNNDNDDDDQDEKKNETFDYEYAEDLDEKLEKFHKTLVRAVAKNRGKKQINEYDP
jgi:cell division protein ZapA (FtsZ GTPase activity inhibitor)